MLVKRRLAASVAQPWVRRKRVSSVVPRVQMSSVVGSVARPPERRKQTSWVVVV